MKRRTTLLAHARIGSLLPVLVVLLLASPVDALEPRGEARFESGPPALGVREPARSVPPKAADRIIRQIEKKYEARVVRQETKERKGRRVLVLRLDDGRRVWKVEVDPETGKEL